METGIKVALLLLLFAALIAALAGIGVPELPEGVDDVMNTVAQYMAQGRGVLNNYCTPGLLTGLLNTAIIMKGLEWTYSLYIFIKNWAIGQD